MSDEPEAPDAILSAELFSDMTTYISIPATRERVRESHEALRAEVEALRRRLADLGEIINMQSEDILRRRDAAEARLTEVEAERDEAKRNVVYLDATATAPGYPTGTWPAGTPEPPLSIAAMGAPEHVEALKAELARGRAAEDRVRTLTEIVQAFVDWGDAPDDDYSGIMARARAVLGLETSECPTCGSTDRAVDRERAGIRSMDDSCADAWHGSETSGEGTG